MFLDGEVGPDSVLLGAESEVLGGRGVGVVKEAALLEGEEAGDQGEEGGFAGAVGADEGDERAGEEIKGDISESLKLVVAVVNPMEGEEGKGLGVHGWLAGGDLELSGHFLPAELVGRFPGGVSVELPGGNGDEVQPGEVAVEGFFFGRFAGESERVSGSSVGEFGVFFVVGVDEFDQLLSPGAEVAKEDEVEGLH